MVIAHGTTGLDDADADGVGAPAEVRAQCRQGLTGLVPANELGYQLGRHCTSTGTHSLCSQRRPEPFPAHADVFGNLAQRLSGRVALGGLPPQASIEDTDSTR